MEQFQPSYRTVVLVKDFVGNLVLIYSRFSRSDGGDMMEDNGWYASIAKILCWYLKIKSLHQLALIDKRNFNNPSGFSADARSS